MINNDSAMHLGNLLKEKLMEQQQNEVANGVIVAEMQSQIDNLRKKLEQANALNDELKTSIQSQRELTLAWRKHSDETRPLYDAVRDIVSEMIYHKDFTEHIQSIAQDRIDTALQDGIELSRQLDYDKLAEAIDYDRIASSIDLGELAADHIDMSNLADNVVYHLSLSDLASELDMADLAMELDYRDLAREIDVNDVADNMSTNDLAEALAQRVKVSVDFNY